MLHKLFILLIFIQPFNGESQNFNVDVAAKILIRSENDLMTIAGTAINQTEINQSLR